ncbi:MAG: FAD-dependent oxidoreductase [Gammaproteobacteria bacterium]|nr:FAD-dependent oxidoreductase [Gammaproteobacteria bacterium]
MVVIVGGGWSGLAAAVELTSRSIPVTLVESADTLGGRARAISHRGRTLDNGQHLIIGAYRELLRLLQLMDIRESDVFERHALRLHVKRVEPDRTRISLDLKPPRLPAPLHIAAALVGAKGIGQRDRWRALRLCLQVALPASSEEDGTVRDFLVKNGQSVDLIEALWGPLCLAIMNTAPEVASAAIFRRTLRDAFMFRRSDSDVLLPKGTLDEAFPRPAGDWIASRGGAILLGTRVTALDCACGAIRGVRLNDGRTLSSDRVILALPPFELARLFDGCEETTALKSALGHIAYEPITTVYLRYPPEVAMDVPMLGFLGTTTQWLLDRRYNGDPGLMAAVISASGAHMALSREALCEQVAAEVALAFPDWPEPVERVCIREKRATFRCETGINALRPGHESGIAGCLIAGDSSWRAYPATLEGALRSGVECARRIA